MTKTPEHKRLAEEEAREANWKRWGPYLSERQWATVREDYSAGGDAWGYFPHDHARSRAYRWGEDGLLGICDRQCRLCFALALWNGRDPILKERLFGLTGPQGNHGEDVKEHYFYLDSTPTHSYLKALYKYPHAAYPYDELVARNAAAGLHDREVELDDLGVFDEGRYFDVQIEYAKASPEDIVAHVRVFNRGPEPAPLHLLPTVWFRNTWSWGCRHEGCSLRPGMRLRGDGSVLLEHADDAHGALSPLGSFVLAAGDAPDGSRPDWLFTHNETNFERLFQTENAEPWVKDAFHRRVVDGDAEAVNPGTTGTKAAAWYRLNVPAGGEASVTLRLARVDSPDAPAPNAGAETASSILDLRRAEADAFYDSLLTDMKPEHRVIARQACAGLLWTKQCYHYIVDDWLKGDRDVAEPPPERHSGRNAGWRHLYARDILSMPDKWEYPWFAAWDLAFHMVPMAEIDPKFAKDQMRLMLREWYLHPNGQMPAYEFKFGDVNPPVHAWASWRIYKIEGRATGRRDREFLASVFQKLLLNFTWWVNRKDAEGHNLFSGGFLGLDNIGVFDRSRPLPGGLTLQQADATAWMGFFSVTMLAMALELAVREDGTIDTAYEDMASKFFEHFIQIVDAINALGGRGLWDEEDGFYFDEVLLGDGRSVPMRIVSLVGLLPLIAVEFLEEDRIARLPGFRKRLDWFTANRPDLASHITYCERGGDEKRHRLLAIPSRDKLERILARLLDEREFLAPFGLRSLSKRHADEPFVLEHGGARHSVAYVPAESDSHMFGGNSNWRGPVWFPTNYLLVEALERYHFFYGDDLLVELPAGSGRRVNLREAARDISRRLASVFEEREGRRPFHGDRSALARDPHSRDLLLFHEYFDPETGRGCGASHQTGWTSLVARLLRKV